MQIGKEALAESHRLGLWISAKDVENEAKDRAEHEHDEPAPAAMRQ
ncbi:hypothetical protein [Neorhizobium galegae]|nr:hypothetical protein [Neorhizobium galegae]